MATAYSRASPARPALSTLVRRVASWYGQQRRCRVTLAELSRLTHHVLAEIGIGRQQIGEISRVLSRRTP